jgi:hypothetical protein
MSLFNRSKDRNQGRKDKGHGSREGITWATNAPSHWPTLITEPLPAQDPKSEKEWAQNHLLFILSITSTLGNAIPGLKVASVSRDYMFPRGFLNVPVEIEEAGKRYPIFYYPQANAEYASKYYGAAEILPRKGVEAPIYYAPSPLPEAPPSNPLRPFSPSMLSKSDSPPSGQYAMWWRTEKDPLFSKSGSMEILNGIYTTIHGINSYVFGLVARALSLVPEDTRRVGLPDREVSIPIKGPEYQHMFISASREKGIRFHFSTTASSSEYRDVFLALFLAFVKSSRAEIEQRQLPMDPPDPDYENGPLDWWSFASQFAQSKEEATGINMFGVIEHEHKS